MGRNQRARQAAAQRTRRIRVAAASAVTVVAMVAAVVVVFQLVGNDDAQATRSAGVDSTAGSVGKSFPDFRLSTLDGQTVAKESLAGEKSLVWFTDAACAPCQVGAVKVRQLNDELADRAIKVVAVFVNPNEPKSAIASWREQYAGKDWGVALDSAARLSTSVDLRALDTKFLLDEKGKILDVDAAPVDDAYLDLLRRQATD
ncbi:MAG: TlpA family protein disulfide reductase [Actinophytocola sp.]|uniref:TlpA family protein disulfide reductase n=1 Tax=Actinophytocola sp. TaxID=1872138 RepID=UPI003D6BBBD0